MAGKIRLGMAAAALALGALAAGAPAQAADNVKAGVLTCNVASGWEKGVVEKNVQDARRRIWIDAKAQRFSSFEELNIWLEERCRALWSELQHPDYAGIIVADCLIPLLLKFSGGGGAVPPKISNFPV